MPITPFSDEEYRSRFLNDRDCNNNALLQALDIRKYEIDHYWKRATYFWTFIAATLRCAVQGKVLAPLYQAVVKKATVCVSRRVCFSSAFAAATAC